ncbi:MAG: hypothetical protein HZC36_16285 [Armatimonadetes bacterium]|nr:hypothetical protein [Armatimonadota bacterium]
MALVGCGGVGPGGGDDGGGGGGGGGGGATRSSVNSGLLAKSGVIDLTVDSGQGRAPGSLVAVWRHQEFTDLYGTEETQLRGEVRIGLDQYTTNSMEVAIPFNMFSPWAASRSFDALPLEIQSLKVENNSGGYVTYTGPGGQPFFIDSFALHATSMPGRRTAIQIFLDDAMLGIDTQAQPPAATFDRDRFEAVNYHPEDLRINGWLADYLCFDISNVANKPEFSASGPYSGEDVTKVYFSGDAYAISGDPVVGGGPMEILTQGTFNFAAKVSPPNGTIGAPGTFTVRQVDPRDLSGIAEITAIQGIWRLWFDPVHPNKGYILNPQAFEALCLPTTEDDGIQELILVARNSSGEITDLYFGEIDYTNKLNMHFSAWPIENIDDGSDDNRIDGTVSGLVYRAGIQDPTDKDIRSGTITITSGTPPATFPSISTFLVVRL